MNLGTITIRSLRYDISLETTRYVSITTAACAFQCVWAHQQGSATRAECRTTQDVFLVSLRLLCATMFAFVVIAERVQPFGGSLVRAAPPP